MARTWDELQAAGRKTEAAEWTRKLVRLGYAARGVVYAVVGVLAVRVAVGRGGRTTDTRGALEEVARAPLGQAILVALGVGFAALALWSLIAAFTDGAIRGGRRVLVSRIGKAVVAFVYGSLAVATYRLLSSGSVGAHDEQRAEGLTARALALPGGRVLVLAAAAVLVVVAARRVWKGGVKRDFLAELQLERMTSRQRAWAARLGSAGIASQGLLFAIVSALLGWAAITHEASKATGLDGALRTVAAQPAGTVLLAVLALGLVAYAAFSLIEARFRRLG